jgi:hypothetical protein
VAYSAGFIARIAQRIRHRHVRRSGSWVVKVWAELLQRTVRTNVRGASGGQGEGGGKWGGPKLFPYKPSLRGPNAATRQTQRILETRVAPHHASHMESHNAVPIAAAARPTKYVVLRQVAPLPQPSRQRSLVFPRASHL